MSAENRAIHPLEGAHAMDLLLVLYEQTNKGKGPPMQKMILNHFITRSSGAIKDRIDELEGLGLITEELPSKPTLPHQISLTPRGREVAEHLAAIKDILQGSKN